MSSEHCNDNASDLQETAEEEELLKLEEEVENMAQKILEYRTTLPVQLNSTVSSVLVSQRPVLPTHLVDEGDPETRMLPAPDAVTQGLMRETLALPAPDNSEEAEKVQVLKQKILSNTSALPVVLNRMKECMARIDKLDSSNVIIHPVFKRKRTN
ncbi:hypothetical protein ACS0TY_002450 [Phlomoides rotata]